MPFKVKNDATFGGIHVSKNAHVNEPTTNNENQGSVKINNDMDIGNDLKVGGIHVKDNGIVTRSKKGAQDLELSETDKQINVEGNLKIGGEYATDNAKILEKLPGASQHPDIQPTAIAHQATDNDIRSRTFVDPQDY